MKYRASIDYGKPDGLVYKDVYIGFTKAPVCRSCASETRSARTASIT